MVETLLVGQYMFLKIVFNLLNYLVSALASNWLEILNDLRTKYYYNIIELSSQIETLNIEFKTA